VPAGEKYVVLQHVQNVQSVGPLKTSVFWDKNTSLMGIRIRNLFDPGSGIRDGKIRIRDKHPKSGINISDPGSGINISDLQHCFKLFKSWILSTMTT
jgi:hypothetical protein